MKKLYAKAKLPTYANPGDAGMDLYSLESYRLAPGKAILVETGIACQLPRNTAGLIWDKSGLAVNHGIKVMGGVIDAGYRGQIRVCLINLSGRHYRIETGDKIAQLLIQPVHRVRPVHGDISDMTVRGKKGFGSSGRK